MPLGGARRRGRISVEITLVLNRSEGGIIDERQRPKVRDRPIVNVTRIDQAQLGFHTPRSPDSTSTAPSVSRGLCL